ncbi:hypothetical protein MKW98_022152 [Papaver atlanticum]|uniref:Yippee domain-containing protein n=1 Tax=Papaver atlanticum TaxID=357466 RepID=A0AAD4XPG0_9MAGN|nr:hypothetical protein MKW98_022152 [Papaver atlanticum]
MAIEEARARLQGLRISDDSTKVVVPTKIEEAGRKYCCATCYNSYGRVTHVASERRVKPEPNLYLPGRTKGQINYYIFASLINSSRVDTGMAYHAGLRKFNTVCSFCGDIVGWHFTAKRDDSPEDWNLDKVVLLDEEEKIADARDRNVNTGMPRMTYLQLQDPMEYGHFQI